MKTHKALIMGREENALGTFTPRWIDFTASLDMSPGQIVAEAIKENRKQGYETLYIMGIER